LLEVGTGFHSELTGRENIYLNGAILGMSQYEINRKFDDIVDFAGVETFIDTPVKHYSSGMRLRLGFSVAAHLEPEILIVDEVLAVGDAEFQRKCLGKMSSVAAEGRTVLFVSHNLAAVQPLCSRGLSLEAGRIKYVGTPEDVIEKYLRDLQDQQEAITNLEEFERRGTGTARYTAIRVLNLNNQEITSVPMGEDFCIELTFKTEQSLRSPGFSVRLSNDLKADLVAWRTSETHGEMPAAEEGGGVLLKIEGLTLLPGTYFLSIGLTDSTEVLDVVEDVLNFQITPQSVYPTGKIPTKNRAIIYTPCSWDVTYS
jgi:lipopolysaccharide transport system ATP-binding protein